MSTVRIQVETADGLDVTVELERPDYVNDGAQGVARELLAECVRRTEQALAAAEEATS